MTCSDLVKHKPSFGDKVAPERFAQLTARELVVGWHLKALAAKDPFEGFIYLWIAFNGWSACVTGLENDRDIVDALSLNEGLCRRFTALAERESRTARESRTFATLWPIFRASELNRRHVVVTAAHRNEQVRQMLEAGVAPAPACWTRHADGREPVPLDWPHTLAAIYRVRNNLFHGNKASDSESDFEIVSAAYSSLVNFVTEAGLLDAAADVPGEPR